MSNKTFLKYNTIMYRSLRSKGKMCTLHYNIQYVHYNIHRHVFFKCRTHVRHKRATLRHMTIG